MKMGAHVGHSLRNLMLLRSQRPAAVCEDREVSGAQLVDRVAALVLGLDKLGIQPGDRVSISAFNSEKYLEWLLAVPCAGGVIAPLNYRWSVEEASEAINQVGARFLVLDENSVIWWRLLKQRCPCLDFLILISEHPSTEEDAIDGEGLILSAGPRPGLVLRHAPEGIALICFTSGTTGKPKGASITHNAIVVQSLAKLAVVGYCCEDVFVHSAPLGHIGGISSALAMVMAGGCQIFLPKFQVDGMLEAIRKYNGTAMITVPVMVTDMASSQYLAARQGKDNTFPSVTKILNGAGGFPASLLEFATETFPRARIMSAYGMTEACSSMAFTLVHEPGRKPAKAVEFGSRHLGGACVGRPAPHVELAIRHETGQIEDVCVEGNVMTRGPHTMSFYWGDVKQTAAALSDDGWLDTGDMGWFDEQGQLWLLGRKKDVVKSGGENVYASEVEAVLLKHPAVLAVAVVGIPDPRLNEAVAAVVCLKQGWIWLDIGQTSSDARSVSTSSLRAHCQQVGLSRYKIPKVIAMQEHGFPATATGKVKKEEIRKALLAKLAKHARVSEPLISRL